LGSDITTYIINDAGCTKPSDAPDITSGFVDLGVVYERKYIFWYITKCTDIYGNRCEYWVHCCNNW